MTLPLMELPYGGLGDGAGLGLIGGIVFTAVAIATIFLLRGMNKRINRLPPDPVPEHRPFTDEIPAPSEDTDTRADPV